MRPPLLLPQAFSEVPVDTPDEESLESDDESWVFDEVSVSDEESLLCPSSPSITGGAGPAGSSLRLAGFCGMYELADGGPLKLPELQAPWTSPQYFSHAVQPVCPVGPARL